MARIYEYHELKYKRFFENLFVLFVLFVIFVFQSFLFYKSAKSASYLLFLYPINSPLYPLTRRLDAPVEKVVIRGPFLLVHSDKPHILV